MNSEEFKARQAPLKERYRHDPSAGVVTLKAQGRLGEEAATCTVATGRALVEAGLHPATGGSGLLLCSGDLMLEALVACAGVTLGSIATAQDLAIRGGTVRAEGKVDFRGTLGVDREAPVGFTDVHVSFELDADLTEEELERLQRLTERYCVVYQTLRSAPSLSMSITNMSNDE